MSRHSLFSFFFFFNDTATTEIYTLSLHDALPISASDQVASMCDVLGVSERHHVGIIPTRSPRELGYQKITRSRQGTRDRKSTRLNSSHSQISYAVFCLKKKNKLDPDHVSRLFSIT